MRRILFILVGWGGLLVGILESSEPDSAFGNRVLPVLVEYCWDCHDPEDSDGHILFLDALEEQDIDQNRAHWRSVAAQLMNRTMPPARKPQPSDLQRREIADWILKYLRETACDGDPYAGYVTARRLNRLEYDFTVRDLVGVDLRFRETLPADSGAGEGFDNNGESLFLPPMLLERYLESAQKIVDEAIVSPRLELEFQSEDLVGFDASAKGVIEADREGTLLIPVYVEDDYDIFVAARQLGEGRRVQVRVDGIDAQPLLLSEAADTTFEFQLRLARGVHSLTFVAGESAPFALERVFIRQPNRPILESARVLHKKLLGVSVGEQPPDPREWALRSLETFVSRAFRRPIARAESERFMVLFDRGMGRGDPYEEAMKLTLKGVMMAPDFLYRIEQEPSGSLPQLITNHELAVRLSYFLWATMPDDELRLLADLGRLHDPAVLALQTDRLLQDPRSWRFKQAFVGQWLGTKDVGGRVAPTHNEIQKFYTPEVAADMRSEAVWLFAHLLDEDRSLLELIKSDYTFLTERLAQFYGYESDYDGLKEDAFTRVALFDDRRGGLLGLGAVLAMTSHFKEKSPVLRGAWVFDTMLGTPVPPPPADVPSIKEAKQAGGKGATAREIIERHQESPSCRSCHRLIDPIGFALNNFDYLGRWEDEENGHPIDSRGKLPTGEVFESPKELKVALMNRKQDFLRQLTRKLLGYALGRGLDDRDECVITSLIANLEGNGFRARSLVHGIVQSMPFRHRQLLVED